MKYLIPIAIFTMLLSGCVVKKDSAASAAVSAEIATQLAKGFSDPTGAKGNMTGTSAALAGSCTISGTTYTCSSGGYEMSVTIGSSSLSGYQKMTNATVTVGGKVYTINGRIDMTGTIATTSNINTSTGQFSVTTNTNETFNGTLKITGPDNFDVEYKAFTVNVGASISGSSASFSYTFSYTCGGKLVVDTVNFPVKSDCSI